MRAIAKKRPKRHHRKRAAEREAASICDSCGEEAVIPVDVSGDAHETASRTALSPATQ